jgi:mannose-6-phosphate isomerase-like protein (cupin superfamily)
MAIFETKRLSDAEVVQAPDGSDVRPLLKLKGGSFAHFELAPGETSKAVAHRTVEEIWYFLSGRGVMWRKRDNWDETVSVEAGVCITISAGTYFQFRSLGDEPLSAIAVTMPPWQDGEAYEVPGKW